MSGSSVSRLTVMRVEPGGLEFGGVLGEQHAVGGERDVLDAGQRREIADQVRRGSARSSGSPPVMRSFLHAGAHEHAREAQDLREIEPLARSSGTRYCSWKVSRGMQYGQRKLQRSMTEMRRSWIGRRSVSTGARRCPSGERNDVFAGVHGCSSPTVEARHESLRKRVGARAAARRSRRCRRAR